MATRHLALKRIVRALGPLYEQPLKTSRRGPLYNAFSYPTKIDAETIALFIATHTNPGETVLDMFAGSGTTGIAARLCDAPTPRMIEMADELGLDPAWGPRNASLYELSPLASLVSDVMSNPPDPAEFLKSATQLVDGVELAEGWIYEATDPEGKTGRIRHTIWSDVLVCPGCAADITFWDAAVEQEPAKIKQTSKCPDCATSFDASRANRSIIDRFDPILGTDKIQRVRVPVRVYGETDGARWERPSNDSDRALVSHVADTAIQGWVPIAPIDWGDLFRSGYHEGISYVHHFYTRRNLRAVSALWAKIESAPPEVRDALRLLVLSYNATHSTLMARVVVKGGDRGFVLTGSQSGVLYVSSLPVEKNVFLGTRRKIQTFTRAFELVHGSRSVVSVCNASSTQLDLQDDSVDYVFTDPPFGDYIPYAEVNQVNEAWLGRLTDRSQEAIVSASQNKGVPEYEDLLESVFRETQRVTKDDGVATVVFHSSKASIWKAIANVLRKTGFDVVTTNILDKTQKSFKQVVSTGGTRGDAMVLLAPSLDPHFPSSGTNVELDALVMKLIADASVSPDPTESSPERLFSRYVSYCLDNNIEITAGSRDFYRIVAERSRLS